MTKAIEALGVLPVLPKPSNSVSEYCLADSFVHVTGMSHAFHQSIFCAYWCGTRSEEVLCQNNKCPDQAVEKRMSLKETIIT